MGWYLPGTQRTVLLLTFLISRKNGVQTPIQHKYLGKSIKTHQNLATGYFAIPAIGFKNPATSVDLQVGECARRIFYFPRYIADR